MKTLEKILIFALITISYFGCFNDMSNEDNLLNEISYNITSLEEGNKNLPTEIYYTFKKDYRRCITPLCGGYWIKAVNIPETVCADGTIGGTQGCYVAGFDLNGIELNKNDIVLGKFRKQQYGNRVADHLDLDSAFTPALSESTPYKEISLIQDNGIRCITTPCYNQQISTVNTDDSWTEYNYKFGVKGRQNRKIVTKAFNDAYNNGGALVQGKWKFSLGQMKRKKLIVTNVYVRKEAQKEESFCTFMKEANSNTFIAWNVEKYEHGKDLLSGADFEPGTEDIAEGTCEEYTSRCPRIYRPVCGTILETGETKTYGNICTFQSAVRRVAGKDAKAKGTWTIGECQVEEPFCTFMKEANSNTFIAWNVDSYEQGKSLLSGADFEPGTENIAEGTCEDYTAMCPRLYRPVCGTILETGETKTYGNLCTFQSAVRRVAGKDAKSKGTWTSGRCQGQVGDSCGGRMGLTCGEGLFCKYELQAMCGATDMTGTCSEYSQICTMEYRPVCGCDGRTYSNECVAWSRGTSASYRGQCRE